MPEEKKLSRVAEKYLHRYDEILRKMILDMNAAPVTGSISANFIRQMLPHHKAAIELAQNLLLYTTCLPLEQMAESIICTQTQSVEKMEAALPGCTSLMNPEQAVYRYQRRYRQIADTMFYRMGSILPENNINGGFMREMIPHHKGAIEMAKNAMCFFVCDSLKPILENIIQTQEQGVKHMEMLLGALTGC